MSRFNSNNSNLYTAPDVDAIRNCFSTMYGFAAADVAAAAESRPGEYGVCEPAPQGLDYAGLQWDGRFQPCDPNVNHMVSGNGRTEHDEREAKREFKMARKSQPISRPLLRALGAAFDADIAAARARGVLEAELAAAGETDAAKAARLAGEALAEQGLTPLKRVLNNKAKRVDAASAGVAGASSKRQRDGLGPPEVMRVAGTTPPPMWNKHYFTTTGIPVNGVLVPEATFKRSRMPDVHARGGKRRTFGNRLVVDYPPDQALDHAFAYMPDFRGKPERALQEAGPVFDPRHMERAMAQERKKARAKAAKAGLEPDAWAAAGQTDDEQSDSDWEQ